MNTEAHNQKTKYKLEIIGGFLFSTLFIWGCISQIHAPLTCQQAREAWQKKQVVQGTSSHQSLEQVIVNRDTIHLCF